MTAAQGFLLQLTILVLGLLVSYKMDKIVFELQHVNATLDTIVRHR